MYGDNHDHRRSFVCQNKIIIRILHNDNSPVSSSTFDENGVVDDED